MRMRKAIGLSLALLFAATTAEAKQAHSSPQPANPSVKAKPGKNDTASSRTRRDRHRDSRTIAASSIHRHDRPARRDTTGLPPADEYIGALKAIGAREVGYAAWYGGRHIGRRTSTGERLDAVHATAAHRSLPLHSLVRVTNLKNGRSIVATINDRGPVSHRLLIDLSPRCADALDMRRAGIVSVSIEPVAPAARPPTQ